MLVAEFRGAQFQINTRGCYVPTPETDVIAFQALDDLAYTLNYLSYDQYNKACEGQHEEVKLRLEAL